MQQPEENIFLEYLYILKITTNYYCLEQGLRYYILVSGVD